MSGDSKSKKKEKEGKRKVAKEDVLKNGKTRIVAVDGTILEKPDYDWSKVEAKKVPKKPRIASSSSTKTTSGKQKKAKKRKSSKIKKESIKSKPLLAMVSESDEFKDEEMNLDPPPPPPPPPKDPFSALSLDDGGFSAGYAVPDMLSPQSSQKNAEMLDSLLKTPARTLSTGTTGDESIMSGSIMSEGGWSDAVSSSDGSEGEF